ncbi:MAG: serine/threonine protein kinase, partial [Deltaproteobacteria bacterium]|nr:serine/threonine protein kinase [Deltaproteobacteria bacterium]
MSEDKKPGVTQGLSDEDRDTFTNHHIGDVVVEPFAPEMELGKRLLLNGQVGSGGTGIIEEVFDKNLLRSVARKVIKPDRVEDEAACGYLVEEAQITAQLNHQQIVPVHELGIDDEGHLYFTMKLIKGRTFKEIIREKGFSERTKRELFEQLQTFIKVCDAVAFAHSRGVIHRDLKTENIMVGEYGEVYLMDWGLAKLKERRPSRMDRESSIDNRQEYVLPDEDGMVRATLAYMAPEQARGDVEAVDERTDVFCLGGIL